MLLEGTATSWAALIARERKTSEEGKQRKKKGTK